jgi:hypothetical protein
MVFPPDLIMFFVAIFYFLPLNYRNTFCNQLESISEKITVGIIYSWPVIAFVFLIPVLNFILDYSRAWQVSSDSKNAFKATGKGIKLLFKRFFPFLLCYSSCVYYLCSLRFICHKSGYLSTTDRLE